MPVPIRENPLIFSHFAILVGEQIYAQDEALPQTIMSSPAGLTLQFNLCAGDIDYAEPILGALITTHRAEVGEVVVVAAACRPQSTPHLQPSQFSAAEFAFRVVFRRTCLESTRRVPLQRSRIPHPHIIRLGFAEKFGRDNSNRC
jgi:hypothetical protein